jgi:electron transfer flavoprotein
LEIGNRKFVAIFTFQCRILNFKALLQGIISRTTLLIFVIAEHKDNKLKSITSELLVFAQRAGRDFGQPVTAVVLGASTAALVEELKGRKIDRILAVEGPQLADYNPDAYVEVLKSLSEEEKPFLVLMGHTTQGMDFAPRLSVALRRPLDVAGRSGGRRDWHRSRSNVH